MTAARDLFSTLLESVRVLAALPIVEMLRRLQGPARGPAARARLRRAIAWVDRCLPGGGCYRRVMLEMALDPAAAREPFRIGLHRRGNRVDGHAWLANRRGNGTRYDVEIEL
jgi:hypothetical protein